MLSFDWYIRATIMRANIRAAMQRARQEDEREEIERLSRLVLAPTTKTIDEPGEVGGHG